MAVNFLLKRSTTASKRPTAAQLDIGELSLNYDAGTAGVFFEDSAGAVRKIGPAEVSATAPNASPAGSSGNSLGELWYDTAIGNLKIFDGTSFVDATTAGAAGGSDTQVQFNSTGSLAGSANFTFNGTTASIAGLSILGTSRFGLAATQDAIELLGRNGGTSSFRVALRPATLSANRTQDLQNLGGVVALDVNKLSFFAATTSAELAGVISDETGSGALVFATSPSLTTPSLGVASATSVNKVAITAPATSATLTIANGKTLTASNTLTFTGTDASSVAFGTGGTVAYTANKLSVFAATTSAELAGVISDETGSGALVFATSPSLTTPAIGAATGTSLVLTGSNTASSFIPTGSTVPTNGLYLPATNSVAISTNSVGRVFVDSAGNVGIGTSSPRSRLEVVAETTFTNNLSNSTNKLGRLLGAPFTNSDDLFLAIDIQGLTADNRILYGGGSALFNAATSHTFFTAANKTTLTGTERMRIDSAGNVGIGTATPTEKLHVNGNTRIDGVVSGTAVVAIDEALPTLDTLVPISTNTSLIFKGRITTGDLNTYYEPGIYQISSGADASGISNTPANNSGALLEVISPDLIRSRGSRNLVVQRYTQRSRGRITEVWHRNSASTSTDDWSDWQKTYTTHTILDTVSQSSGVPTGGVIQQGSNANGIFTRYADGTQICHARPSITPTANAFTTDTLNWPVSFSSSPRVAVNVDSNVYGPTETLRVWHVSDQTSSGYTLRVFRTNTTATASSVFAVGRWF